MFGIVANAEPHGRASSGHRERCRLLYEPSTGDGVIPISHRSVAADGVRLHLAEAGRGELLLCLHGFPESWMSWRPLMAALGAERRVAAYDGRGYGRSDRPAARDAYQVDRLVADVLAVADACGTDRFALAGHDWGGLVAWVAAARHPDRVARLAILNAPHPTLLQARLDDDPAQRAASAYVARLVSDDPMPADALWQATFAAAAARGLVPDDERAALLEAWARPGAIEAMRHWYRAAPFDFGAGRLAAPLRVEVPTLVLWGMEDRVLLPGLLDGLDALVPDLTLVRLPDAGHSVLRERPDRVAASLRAFL